MIAYANKVIIMPGYGKAVAGKLIQEVKQLEMTPYCRQIPKARASGCFGTQRRQAIERVDAGDNSLRTPVSARLDGTNSHDSD